MADLRSIGIGMRTNTGPLEKGFGKATGIIGGFARSVSSMGSGIGMSVGKVVTGLGSIGLAAQGLSAIKGAFSGVMDGMGDLADNAARLGIGAVELKNLGFAAEQSGVDAETLQKSMQKFQRGLGDLQTGKAADDLNMLGLSAKDFTGNVTTDFQTVAQSISKMTDPVKKADAAFKIFGKSGQEMMVLLNSGAAGIQSSMAQASSLGFGLSEEDIAAAEEAGDMLDKVGFAMSSIAQVVMGKASPAITFFGQKLIDVAAWGASGFQTLTDGLTASASFMMPVLEQLGNVFSARIGSIVDTATWCWTSLASLWNGAGLPTFAAMREGILVALIGAEFGFTHFWSILKLGATAGLAGIVQFGGIIGHTFTEVIPGYLSWCGDNWQVVIGHIANESVKRFENLTGNIVSIFSNLPGLIAGTTDWSEVWQPFEATALASVVDLPEIPERVMGDFEKSLHSQVEDMKGSLGKSFEDLKAERMGKLLSFATPVDINASTAPKPVGIDPEASSTTSAKEMPKLLSANVMGSQGARESILRHEMRGTGGVSGDPKKVQAEQLQTQKRMEQEQRRTNKILTKWVGGGADTITVNLA